jgi:hypothetical protein
MTATNDYIGVSLQLWSSVRSPEEMSAMLERTPSATGTMGAPRGHYIDGTPSLWKAHYWCDDFKDGETVEERIEAVASFLAAKKAELESILAKDGKAAIYVYLDLDATLGIELEPSLLRVLGDMGVELGFEISGRKKVPVEASPKMT